MECMHLCHSNPFECILTLQVYTNKLPPMQSPVGEVLVLLLSHEQKSRTPSQLFSSFLRLNLQYTVYTVTPLHSRISQISASSSTPWPALSLLPAWSSPPRVIIQGIQLHSPHQHERTLRVLWHLGRWAPGTIRPIPSHRRPSRTSLRRLTEMDNDENNRQGVCLRLMAQLAVDVVDGCFMF